MSIKKMIKSIIPISVWCRFQKRKAEVLLRRYNRIQRNRFLENCSCAWNVTDKERLRAKMMYYIHRIEKGLSHSDFRAGFGKNALTVLSASMQEWADLGFSVSDLTYVGGQQVVKAYLNRHKTLHKTLPTFISELFDMDFSMSQSQLMCGVKTITHEEKQNNKQLRFEELFTQRTSIREFSAKNVDMKKIENAVQIAMKTPTVCNRQSFKLTLIRDKKIIEEALVLQGGWRGYPAPPLLGLVTVDVRGYVNVEERNEPFIDGGLFGMSLLLCLEAEEIATCPLNTMFSDICEQRLRQLLKLPEFEEFIMFVAIGEFPESVLAPKSMRYPAAEVMRVIE